MIFIWDWVAKLAYSLLFALLGIYAVLAAINRPVILSRWQAAIVFMLAAIVAGALALTFGFELFDAPGPISPFPRAASAGIVVVLLANLVYELRRMKP